jgi:hypothetical protein
MNKQPLTGSIKKSELIQILIKECKLKFGVYSAKTLLPQPVFILIDFFLVFTVNNDVIRIIFHLVFDVIRFNKPSHFYLKFHFIIICLRSLNSHVNRLCCVVNPKVAYVYILFRSDLPFRILQNPDLLIGIIDSSMEFWIPFLPS